MISFQPFLVEVPLLPVGLGLALDLDPGEAECAQGRRVEIELMGRAVPDDDGAGRADGVEQLPRQWPVPERVVAPGEQELLGVRQRGVRLAEPRLVFVRVGGRLDGPVGKRPVLDGDDLDRQAKRPQDRVQVLLDQAGQKNLAGEPRVHPERSIGQGLLHLVERADGQDPVALHGDRGRRRVGRLHGVDHLGREDANRPVRGRGGQQDVQVALGERRRGSDHQKCHHR